MSGDEKIVKFPKKPARKRVKRSSRQLRPRTAEDIANAQTAEQLALRIWAAMAAQNALSAMAALIDELIGSYLLDDDDEEADEGGLDAHKKREKEIFDEAIADALDQYPDFSSISELLPNDPDVARDVEQLKNALAKCAIGATKFRERFSRAQLARMAKRDFKILFKKDPRYCEHVREGVPGTNVRKYGTRGRTSSRGTFTRINHDGLIALLTGGWIRVAKDRVEPLAWSHRYGFERKTEKQIWRHHFLITERDGHQSEFALAREKLAGNGASAIRALMRAGVHVVRHETAQRALVQFLHFKPKREIARLPRVGWAQVGSHWIFVRPDGVLAPADIPQAGGVTYVLDATATQHGLHVAGTAAEWAAEIAAPLAGNSSAALALGTFFAAPLLCWASEPGGGFHLHGPSSIGKSMTAAVGQTVYGWPLELADDAFGATWAGSAAGFDALALARTDLGLSLDEITLANRRSAEQIVYKLAGGSRGARATSTGGLREAAHASVLVFSTGEKSLAAFLDQGLQEGAKRRLVDVPAEVQPGSAFEMIPRDRIHIESKRLFASMRRLHGAVGRHWQQHLVDLGPDKIKSLLHRHREAFLALPEVLAVAAKAHPQVRAVVNRFALLAAALRMVIASGLLPWSAEEADAGITACMARWVAQRGNLGTAGEVVRAACEVERKLMASLQHRFIHIHRSGGKWTPVSEVDGFRQRTPELFDGYVKPDRVLVRPEAWRRYCAGFDPGEIARHFQRRGVLIDGDSDGSRAEQVIGKVKRFYALSRAALTPLTP
jgi:uncharacterized protein (DUF927 family)